jgi:hypothetical protein
LPASSGSSLRAVEAAATVPPRRKSVKFYDQLQQQASSSSDAALLHADQGCGRAAFRRCSGSTTETALEFWQRRLALHSVAKTEGCRVILPEPLNV